MTPETVRALQWATLTVFGLLAVASFVTGWRRPSLRAVSWALFLVAANHMAWYIAFLVFPGWLSATPTMVWSVILRMHVAFTGILWLIIAVMRTPR